MHFFLLATFFFLSFSALAQHAGDNDPTFNTVDTFLFSNRLLANATVRTISPQTDGKIIIGGEFTTYNGETVNRIARIFANGILDLTFISNNGFNSTVFSTCLQPDGKIIVGGSFMTYDNNPAPRIIRLNADGSIDNSFNPGTGPNNIIRSVSLQVDGKMVVGGNFTTFNGSPANSIVRLNSDGSIDTTFESGSGAYNMIITSAIQPDGKIIIGGAFTFYDNTSINRIARLDANGHLDTTFHVGTGANSTVSTSAIQPDGKIIFGGAFTFYNDTSFNRIVRLYADGRIDTSFNIGLGANNQITAANVQPDGKIVIGGAFTSYNNTAVGFLTRLNTDGSRDTTFKSDPGANSSIFAIRAKPDGKIIISGGFTTYDTVSANRILVLDENGQPDNLFNLGSMGANQYLFTSCLQADGKIIIGGFFSRFNGKNLNKIARLNADGSIDSTFNIGTGFELSNSEVTTCMMQPDDKIVVGGDFFMYNGNSKNPFVIRLLSDGTLDTTFNHSLRSRYRNGFRVCETALQADGKILVAGTRLKDGFPNSLDTFELIRLLPDGSTDSSFTIGIGSPAFSRTKCALAIQPNGKIIVSNIFTSYNGFNVNRLVRLNEDGSIDNTFNMGLGPDKGIFSIVLLQNGKLLVGGAFTSYNGSNINYIARLNSDGTLDTSFNTGIGPDNAVFEINLQSDGKIVITGSFTSFAGSNRNRLARLHPDGRLDNCFDPQIGVNDLIFTISTQADDNIIIGGAFDTYNNVIRNRIARIKGDGVFTSTDVVSACDSSFTWIDGITYTADTNTPTFLLTNSNGCEVMVTLNLSLNNLINFDLSIDTNYFPLGVFKSNENSASYQWLDCKNGNIPLQGEVNQYFYPYFTGFFGVELSKSGCVDTTDCYNFLFISTQDLASPIDIRLFPNPSSDEFSIEVNQMMEEMQLTIHNTTGKQMMTKALPPNEKLVVDMSAWSKGVYLVKFTGSQYATMRKVVKL